MSPKGQPLASSHFRVLTSALLMEWLTDPYAFMRVTTSKDVLPGNWAAYMMPGLVDWKKSALKSPNNSYLVQNVNSGGNIVADFTDLVTARIPMNSLVEVQLVLVPLDHLGTRGLVDHAMLRFIFDEQAPIRIASAGNTRETLVASDFLISWEAWRAPGRKFNLIDGFNPDTYKLVPRFYIAAHRFLEDSVKERHWTCYPLDMPGDDVGRSEVLQMALSLADSVARNTLVSVLAHTDHCLENSAITNSDTRFDNLSRNEERCDSEIGWCEIDEVLRSNQLPDSPMENMSSVCTSYQLLLRSCATMALHSIELAVKRISSHGIMSADDVSAFENLQIIKPIPWLESLGNSGLKNIVRQAPWAIWWIARHQEVIPTKIPGILHKAGLLKLKNGEPVMHHYFSGSQSPYIDRDVFLSD